MTKANFMGKVIYGMFVSLDGFIEGPNKELDWHILGRPATLRNTTTVKKIASKHA